MNFFRLGSICARTCKIGSILRHLSNIAILFDLPNWRRAFLPSGLPVVPVRLRWFSVVCNVRVVTVTRCHQFLLAESRRCNTSKQVPHSEFRAE